MVDWSAANARKANRADCIWIASGHIDDSLPHLVSPASRTEAMQLIALQLNDSLDRNERVLLGFDFAFGYPAGFANRWLKSPKRPAWLRTWEYLHRAVCDDLGTKPGQRPSNRSNRFDVGNEINRMISDRVEAGPFWCCEPNWRKRTADLWMPSRQPTTHRILPPLRRTDRRLNSSTPFCLYRTGSVGSQTLVGIPRVQQLRLDFGSSVSVWPMETGWLEGAFQSPVIVCEIYPSIRQPLQDEIKDRGQVRAVWKWARDQTRGANLEDHFRKPQDFRERPGCSSEADVLDEEGWILS